MALYLMPGGLTVNHHFPKNVEMKFAVILVICLLAVPRYTEPCISINTLLYMIVRTTFRGYRV